MNFAVLNWIDWTIITVLTASTLLSLWRGFAREALSLLGWVVAYVLANLLAGRLSALSADLIHNASARYVAAFAVLFVAVLLMFNLVNVLVKHLIRLTGLSVLDRLLGTVFGFTRGLIVLLVAIFFLRELIPPGSQQDLQQSLLVPHLDMLMQWARSMFGKMDLGSILDNGVPQISI